MSHSVMPPSNLPPAIEAAQLYVAVQPEDVCRSDQVWVLHMRRRGGFELKPWTWPELTAACDAESLSSVRGQILTTRPGYTAIVIADECERSGCGQLHAHLLVSNLRPLRDAILRGRAEREGQEPSPGKGAQV